MVNELTGVVNATWTDLTIILLASEMMALDWENAVRQAIAALGEPQIVTPFSIVHLMPFIPSPELSGGDGDMYTVQAGIYYVTRKPTTPGIEATVGIKLEALREALRVNTHTYFMLHENPIFDASENNPANRVLVKQGNQPLFAGQLQAQIVCGLSGF